MNVFEMTKEEKGIVAKKFETDLGKSMIHSGGRVYDGSKYLLLVDNEFRGVLINLLFDYVERVKETNKDLFGKDNPPLIEKHCRQAIHDLLKIDAPDKT